MALKRLHEGPIEPESPSKKTRKQDDSRVDPPQQLSNENAPFLQYEVRQAIQKHLTGNNGDYDRIKSAFESTSLKEEAVDNVTVEQYIVALSGNVALLQSSCSDLIHTVLHSTWASKSDEYVTAYMRFLGNLLSIRGTFLIDVLRMLADHFTYEPTPFERVATFSRALVYHRSHRLLQYILRLVPVASHELLRTLTSLFPHQSDSRRAHVIYVKNLLKLAEYAPEFREEVEALITDRLVKIDVQMQEDIEELADEISEGVLQNLPSLQDQKEITDGTDTESEADDLENEDLDAQRTYNIRRNIGKLDALMSILFEHYDREMVQSSRLGGLDVLERLLAQFERTILPSQRSRHTQFLLFHFAQSSSKFMDVFFGTCIDFALYQRQPTTIRHSAAAYLASFVARGAHVPPMLVRDVFDHIGNELNKLRKLYEPKCQGPDLWRYPSYYNLVQSLLYIFCFRWRDLEYNLDEDGDDEEFPTTLTQDHQWRPGVKEVLHGNIFSRLNPLKVCSDAIVSEFAQIARHVGIAYVYHLLETNKRIRMLHSASAFPDGESKGILNPTIMASKRSGEVQQHLDAFFPFDPYHLPQSKKWIEPDYRAWEGIPGLEDNSEDDSDESDEVALSAQFSHEPMDVLISISDSP